jgi:nucleotide-binding universal stress UspA family protein
MSGSIICAVDDSKSGQQAARVARGLSAQLGLRLVFLRVLGDGSQDEKINAVAERLQHLTEDAPELDGGADWHVDVGDPAERLLAAAADENASLIVVGSGGPPSPLNGDFSAKVSRRAPCPVVVVPPGADQALNGHHARHDHLEFDGGIVRFNLGGGRN